LTVIGELAASVAHELNNPLTVIHGYVEFLSMKLGMSSEYNRYLEMIINEAKKCKKIIDELLEFSSKDDGTREWISLKEVIEKSIAIMDHHVNINDIKIILSLSETLPEIFGNKMGLQQVFVNLIANSAQHMENGGTIKITLQRKNEKIAVLFEDDGPGIKAEIRDRVFLPFFSTRDGGSGLGLSVCKKIIEQIGGNIKLDNTNGKGCRFILEFPVS
jgi:signal transduction histidine kinase